MNTRNRRLTITGAANQSDRARPPDRAWRSILAAALLLAAGLLTPAMPAHAAGTITVNTTVDEFDLVANASCSLREAIQSANTNTDFGGCVRSGTPSFTINLPAGTFLLTTIVGFNPDDNTNGDLDIVASGTALSGAGASSTIIQQTTADRVIDFNPLVVPSFSGSLSNLRVTGGNTSSPFGGGGIIYGDSNGAGTLTLTNVTVDGNTATAGGGGGIEVSARGNLIVSNSTIADNTASSTTVGQGGGIHFFAQGVNQLTITNSTISGNRAGYTFSATAGGGLMSTTTGGTVTIQRTHFVNNRAANAALTATASGGAIAHVNGALNVSFSRFVGNVALSGSGVYQASGGTSTANDNWWGVNTGPGAGVLAGAPLPIATRWLQLRHSASPSPIAPTGTSTLTADLFGLNTGGSTAAANLSGLPPFPTPPGVIFSNAVLGTLSGASTQFVNGVATATYTAGPTAGAGSADATADSQTVTAQISVLPPLGVTLAEFSVEPQVDRMLVRWETVSELGNLGFNLWRGVTSVEPDAQLNATLIPSHAPGSAQGYSYEWNDQESLVAGATYYYWLEDVSASGGVTRHGPVSATFGAPTAVTLSTLSASPAAPTAASWVIAALLASLAAALISVRRRRDDRGRARDDMKP